MFSETAETQNRDNLKKINQKNQVFKKQLLDKRSPVADLTEVIKYPNKITKLKNNLNLTVFSETSQTQYSSRLPEVIKPSNLKKKTAKLKYNVN